MKHLNKWFMVTDKVISEFNTVWIITYIYNVLIIHESLHFLDVCALWVLHQSTDTRKKNIIELFKYYGGDSFLKQIITADESQSFWSKSKQESFNHFPFHFSQQKNQNLYFCMKDADDGLSLIHI